MRCIPLPRLTSHLSSPVRRPLLLALTALCVVTVTQAQESNNLAAATAGTSVTVQNTSAPAKTPVPSDITVEGMASYGNYRIFAGGSNCKLYTMGIEYDRHTWGTFLRARMDWAAEILPLMVLNEPAVTDIWGDTVGPGRKTIPGIGISPIGLRMVWRQDRGIRPYFDVKGGMLAFTQKAISNASTYQNFTLQQNVGLLIKASPRYDLRLGLFGDFHFSNAFAVAANPGLDVMNATLGLTYHLGKPRVE